MSCFKAMAGYKADDIKGVGTEKKTEERKTYKLPKAMKPSKETFESLGFIFKDIGDDVMYQVTLPKGWTIKPSAGYWSYLVDEKDRRRGSSFYKRTYFTHRGNMHLVQRFHKDFEYDDPESMNSPVNVYVIDYDGTIVFRAGQAKEAYSKEFYELMNKANEYLIANYPDWNNPTKYWD